MAAHAHLKKEFMEDEKYHNLMTWLQWSLRSYSYFVLSSWLQASNNFPNPSKFLFLSCSCAIATNFLVSMASSPVCVLYILASVMISCSVMDGSTCRKRAPSWSNCIMPVPLGSFLMKKERTSSDLDPTMWRIFATMFSTLALGNWKKIQDFSCKI